MREHRTTPRKCRVLTHRVPSCLMETWLTVNEVAAYLGLSRQTVYRLMASDELEYVMVGTRRRVSRAAIDAYLARNLQAVQDAAKEEG